MPPDGVTVTELAPDPATEAVIPVGKPEAVSVTLPEKVPPVATVIRLVTEDGLSVAISTRSRERKPSVPRVAARQPATAPPPL